MKGGPRPPIDLNRLASMLVQRKSDDSDLRKGAPKGGPPYRPEGARDSSSSSSSNSNSSSSSSSARSVRPKAGFPPTQQLWKPRAKTAAEEDQLQQQQQQQQQQRQPQREDTCAAVHATAAAYKAKSQTKGGSLLSLLPEASSSSPVCFPSLCSSAAPLAAAVAAAAAAAGVPLCYGVPLLQSLCGTFLPRQWRRSFFRRCPPTLPRPSPSPASFLEDQSAGDDPDEPSARSRRRDRGAPSLVVASLSSLIVAWA
ncbi:hypothetical protein Emed_007325 [Eimeria media]